MVKIQAIVTSLRDVFNFAAPVLEECSRRIQIARDDDGLKKVPEMQNILRIMAESLQHLQQISNESFPTDQVTSQIADDVEQNNLMQQQKEPNIKSRP
ncbi:unnamed protein product [Rotaria sp. Silwood2]|nr:unnamed protein product [Rotaria sp. Silwood2]CAF4736603.1 unnamed protein product [Rotaria sp. Silwood2]